MKQKNYIISVHFVHSVRALNVLELNSCTITAAGTIHVFFATESLPGKCPDGVYCVPAPVGVRPYSDGRPT